MARALRRVLAEAGAAAAELPRGTRSRGPRLASAGRRRRRHGSTGVRGAPTHPSGDERAVASARSSVPVAVSGGVASVVIALAAAAVESKPMQAAKARIPASLIALALVLAIAAAVPAAATIPAADLGLVDLEGVSASPATSPLLPPAEMPIALPPPAHGPPVASLEAAPNHHLRVALAVAVARLSTCPQAENRIRGRAAVGSEQLQQNQWFRPGITPGVCDGPNMYQGFGLSPLNYGDPLGLRIGIPETVPGSPVGTGMVEGFKGAFDSSNPLWARGLLFLGGVTAIPGAGVEGVLNFLHHVDVGTDRASHRIATAAILEDDPLEQTKLVSQAVGDLAFLSVEGIAIGLPGANVAASPVAQGVSRTAGAVNRAVNPMRWFDDFAAVADDAIVAGAREGIDDFVRLAGAHPHHGQFLTSAQFRGLPMGGSVDPLRVRFSQHSIYPDFRDPSFGSVDDLAQALRSGSVGFSQFKPVRLVEKDGMVFSLDNRRLYAFQKAGVRLPYIKLEHVPKRQVRKFNTKNDGLSVIVLDRRP